jgi:hypothetical protein
MIGIYSKRYGTVRVTHKPTGVHAESDSQSSAYKNRECAMAILRARLYAALHLIRSNELVRCYNLPDGADRLPDTILDEIGVPSTQQSTNN